eukprot:1158400-Pelagomonas_calceolata.AAC.11
MGKGVWSCSPGLPPQQSAAIGTTKCQKQAHARAAAIKKAECQNKQKHVQLQLPGGHSQSSALCTQATSEGLQHMLASRSVKSEGAGCAEGLRLWLGWDVVKASPPKGVDTKLCPCPAEPLASPSGTTVDCVAVGRVSTTARVSTCCSPATAAAAEGDGSVLRLLCARHRRTHAGIPRAKFDAVAIRFVAVDIIPVGGELERSR